MDCFDYLGLPVSVCFSLAISLAVLRSSLGMHRKILKTERKSDQARFLSFAGLVRLQTQYNIL